MIHKLAPTFVAISILTGCASNLYQRTPKLVEKKEVSVNAALNDIAVGIVNMRKELETNQAKVGVYIDSIDLDLVLDSTQDEHGNVTVGLNPINLTSISKTSGNLSADEYKGILDKRNSTVKIRFKSVNSLDKPVIPDTVLSHTLDCKGKDKITCESLQKLFSTK